MAKVTLRDLRRAARAAGFSALDVMGSKVARECYAERLDGKKVTHYLVYAESLDELCEWFQNFSPDALASVLAEFDFMGWLEAEGAGGEDGVDMREIFARLAVLGWPPAGRNSV